MDWPHLVTFNLTLLAAMIAPGPALLFMLRQSVVGGLRAGVLTGLGLASMAATWTLAAFMGLEIIFVMVPWAYVALKVGGALYLMFVAYVMWRDARLPLSTQIGARRHPFFGGLLINLANPKSVLFAASVLLVIFPRDMSLASKGLVIANHFVVEVSLYALMAALLSRGPAQEAYLRLKAQFDRIASGVLAALGLRLLLDR